MNNEKTSALSESQLSDFFADQLHEIFRSEKRILEALPQLQNAAHASDLKKNLLEYYSQLQKEIIRLEGIFTILDIPATDGKAEATEALLAEANTVIGKTMEGSHTRDAAIIIAVQKIGHYKIATYGSLQQLATTLGMEDITNLLSQSLQEEKDNDVLLSDIADKKINWLAEIEPKA
jgi:ferritin-like metal-binding protein YciE